jgi:creatinine amidohydrolase
MSKRNIRFELMRPGEIVEEKERCPLIYLPIGPLEWHGPHMPLGVDPINAAESALRLCDKTGGVVLPTLYMGTERERAPQMLKNIGFEEDEWVVGMDFPENSMKSLYFSEEIFAVTIRAWLEQLVDQGYKLIVIVNGHGAENQLATLKRLCAEYTQNSPARVLFFMPMPGFVKEESSWAHATADETSVLMACYPDTVDMSTLPPKEEPLDNKRWGIIDNLTFRGEPTEGYTVRPGEDPRLAASVEKGIQHMETAVDEIAELVLNALNEIK